MEAAVDIERQTDEPDEPLDADAIKCVLAEAGIQHGIDDDACGQLAESANALPVGGRITQIVARGTAALDGEDGRIEMAVEYHRDQIGLEHDFGKIDFHQRGAFTGIEKGQLIATIVLPTPGTPGVNVFGKEIKAQAGKPAVFRAGQGTKVEANRTELRATRTGDLKCAGELIEVMDMIRVPGNLDFAVGNIDCEGPVRIQGDVLPGFHVHAGGDVMIAGVVDSAEVNSSGTVIVSQGVLRGSRIYAKKGIVVGYVRESYLESESTIKVVNEAVNSTVISADNIAVSSSGRVVGGRLLARHQIEVGIAGHANGIPTVLAAGVNPLDEFHAAKLEANIHRTIKREAVVDRMKQLATPDTHAALEQLAAQQTTKRERHMEALADLNQNAVAHADSRIKVGAAIYPGVVIRIGPAELPIKSEQSGGTYTYDTDSGEVVGVQPRTKA